MNEENLLSKFGIPTDKLLSPTQVIDETSTYTLINISRKTIILYDAKQGMPIQGLTLYPFGYIGCATSIPGSILNLMPNRTMWGKGLIAVLNAPDLDTSFLANCVPLGAKNPWLPPYFSKEDYSYKTIGEESMASGTVLPPEKLEPITKPLAQTLNNIMETENLNPRNGAPQKVVGEFDPNQVKQY